MMNKMYETGINLMLGVEATFNSCSAFALLSTPPTKQSKLLYVNVCPFCDRTN